MGGDVDQRGAVMIVTGCNGRPGLITIIEGNPVLLETGDTRGACFVGNTLFYLTRNGLWRQHEGETAEHLYDVPLEWHGLHNAGDCLLAPDPVSDLIHEFTMDGKYVRPISWKEPGTKRLHTNDCWRDGLDLWLSCFGLGICKNGVPMGWGTNAQPHTPIRWQGKTYWCASNHHKVMRDNEEFAQLGGFTRGLCATARGLWVGLSTMRHTNSDCNGQVLLYSWAGELLETIDLPTEEVYAITVPQ